MLPVFPIGGIGPSNAGDLARAGADRVAVGSSVLEAEDPAVAVREIARALER
jgi:thiamine-phosphate pyrophosphorylase